MEVEWWCLGRLKTEEELKKTWTAQTAPKTAVSGSGNGSGMEPLLFSSAAVDSGQCVTAAETAATGSGDGSGRRDFGACDHGLLSGLINTV